MDSIEVLNELDYLYIYFNTLKITEITSLNNIIVKMVNLTYLYVLTR